MKRIASKDRKSRQTFSRPASRRPVRPHLICEPLEDRVLPSIFDGSFQTIALTNARQDPVFQGIDGRGIGVAIIDEGLHARNPELQPNFVHWYDAVTRQDFSFTNIAENVAAAFDPSGHGSHVAGIAASNNPDIGVASGASIIGIRALPQPNESLPRNYDPVAGALQWVVDHYQQFNIKVVNMSLGVYSTNINNVQSRIQGEAALIAQLEGLGVTVVSATGNNYASFVSPGAETPAAFSTISVANTWSVTSSFNSIATWAGSGVSFGVVERESAVDRVAASSQRSTLPNQVAAPGQNILSNWNGTGNDLRKTLSGTSMASPLVAGTVALMQQTASVAGGRYLSPTEILSILKDSADTIFDSDVPSNGRVPIINGNPAFNSQTALAETGIALQRINVHRALQQVRFVVSGAIPGTGDANSTTATAIDLATLDGSRPFSFQGNIGVDGQVQVGANDIDLFKVTTVSPGSLALSLAPVGGGTSFDSFLRLFDANGSQLAANDDASQSTRYSALSSAQLPAGTYYIGVSSFDNSAYNIQTGAGAANGGSTGDYLLTVNLNNPDPNGVVTGAVAFAGLPIGFVGIIDSDPPPPGSTTRVQIGPQDVDIFEVIIPDDGSLTVETDTSAYGAQGVDTFLRIFNAQGNVLASHDDISASNTDSRIVLQVTLGQTIYVGVSDFNNQAYSPFNPFGRSNTGSGGSYDLSMTFDNGDQNGTVFTAVAATVGQDILSTVGSDPLPAGGRVTVGRNGAKDVDFLAYTPATGGLLDVNAVGQDGFIPSLSLWVLNNAQTDVVKVGETTTTNTELIFSVQANTTYYIAVTGVGNNDFDWYAPGSGTGGQIGTTLVSTALLPASAIDSLSDNRLGSPAVQTVALDASLSGNVGMDASLIVGAADVDLYRFVATTTEALAFSTSTSTEGSSDTFLRLFTASGQELAANDDANATTTASLIVFSVVAGQTYFIGVNGYSVSAGSYDAVTGVGAAPGSQGTYVLNVAKAPVAIFVTGADAGGGPDVKVFDARTGQLKFGFFAYDANFTGGVRVAAGDVNGDRVPDVVCAAGLGGGPNVTVFDGRTGQRLPGPIGSFFAYDPGFTGGVYVAAGDVNSDGFADIICGADGGGGPNVTVFSGRDGSRLMSFFAYDSGFTGGVRVAAGDVNGDSFADLVCGAGPGGGPNVTVYSGIDGARLLSFFAYDSSFAAGIYVGSGDVDGDGKSDVVAGAGPGGGPNVAVFSGIDGRMILSYFPYAAAFTGGVRVAAVDRTGSGRDAVISVAGPGGGPDVRTFDALSGQQIDAFFAYNPLFTGGLYVTATNR